jgi:hypothetical protein
MTLGVFLSTGALALVAHLADQQRYYASSGIGEVYRSRIIYGPAD